MIKIINFGLSNIGSIKRALDLIKADCIIIDEPEQLDGASHIILPGVGSFADGMKHLHAKGWIDPIRNAVLKDNIPILGICLGMQLFASRGTEGGYTEGLDLIPGEVISLSSMGCKKRIPHVGWNDISYIKKDCSLLSEIPEGTDFYFIHSYNIKPDSHDHIIALTNYDIPIVAVVENCNIWGTQFHPEKSSKAGIKILRNFVSI